MARSLKETREKLFAYAVSIVFRRDQHIYSGDQTGEQLAMFIFNVEQGALYFLVSLRIWFLFLIFFRRNVHGSIMKMFHEA
jgi:hypothetical protein